jgi:hypothetical protein
MRKKSENLSNIIKPLHFGHSMIASWVAMVEFRGGLKQIADHIPFFSIFNWLDITGVWPPWTKFRHEVTKMFLE